MVTEAVRLDFNSIRELYNAYMPYLKYGGLFVAEPGDQVMGAAVQLVITLPDSPETEVVEGTVVWLTPQGTHSATPSGFGVGFHPQFFGIQARIEKLLGSMLNAGEPTATI